SNAAVSVNCMPVNCIPSPESPEKRITILSTSIFEVCLSVGVVSVSILLIMYAEFLFLKSVVQQFQHMLHPAHNNQPGKQKRIVALHESPGIRCICWVK